MFRSLPSSFEEIQTRRTELERREVERGLLPYLVRIATGVFGGMAFVMSSLVLWRRYHPDAFRPSGASIALTTVFLFVFALWIAFWEFRRKQKRLQLSPELESSRIS